MRYVLLLLATLFTVACSSEPPGQAVDKNSRSAPPEEAVTAAPQPAFLSISAQQAQALLSRNKGMMILDTRTPRELQRHGAIAGSKLASLQAIFYDQLPLDKQQPILVVCAVGGRSYAAGQVMVKHGYKRIYNLRGGLAEWKQAGLPVVMP